MAFLDRFEKGVERAVNSPFAKTSRSEVKPVELASALRRELDDKAAVLGRGRAVVPNDFVIVISQPDFEKILDWGAEAMGEELQEEVAQYAASQRYAFVGPVSVQFEEDTTKPPGQFEIRSATVRGAVAPATTTTASARHPIVDIDGQRYLLTGQVTVIGRGSDADIIVEDTGVSRRHLEIRLGPDGPIATDLGSTNGTFVEGHRITNALLVDGNTITVGRTQIVFWTGDTGGDGEYGQEG
jgi:pSer/pThr/pTyr-binding forkhead associated (FHA) protein